MLHTSASNIIACPRVKTAGAENTSQGFLRISVMP